VSDPGVDPLLEVVLLGGVELTSATCHDVTVTGDGIGHVEVVDGIGEESLADFTVASVGQSDSIERAGLDVVVSNEMGSNLGKTGSDFIKRVVRKRGTKLLRESTEDHPVVTGKAWGSDSVTRLLGTSVHVDESSALLEITGSREDQIGIVDTFITGGSHVDNIGVLGDIFVTEVISAEKEDELSTFHGGAGHDTKIESADTGSLGVEDVDTVPAFSLVDNVGLRSDLIDEVLDGSTVLSGESIVGNHDHGEIGLSDSLTEGVGAVGDLLKGLERVTEMAVVVGHVVGGSNDGDIEAVDVDGLADTGVKDGVLSLRVGTNHNKKISLIDSGNTRVHEILGSEIDAVLGHV